MSEQSALELSNIITRNDTILGSDLGDEVVMMDINSGQYFNMKAVAASVWNLLEQPQKLSDILKALNEEFEVDPETCEKEVRAFVLEMKNHGIVSFS